MFKFKNLRRETHDYDHSICCVVGCNRESEIIVGTKRFSNADLPLCEKHWIKYCEIPFEKKEGHNECQVCKEAREKPKEIPVASKQEEATVPVGQPDCGVAED